MGAAALPWDQCLKGNTMRYRDLFLQVSSGCVESPCSRAWESPPPGQRAEVGAPPFFVRAHLFTFVSSTYITTLNTDFLSCRTRTWAAVTRIEIHVFLVAGVFFITVCAGTGGDKVSNTNGYDKWMPSYSRCAIIEEKCSESHPQNLSALCQLFLFSIMQYLCIMLMWNKAEWQERQPGYKSITCK